MPSEAAIASRRDRVVAGEHLQVDPSAARVRHRLGGGRAQRIVERDKAYEDELTLHVVLVQRDARLQLPLRDGENAEALLGPCLRRLLEQRARRVVDCALGDELRRTLDVGDPPLGPAQDDRHPLPHCIERDLMDSGLAPAGREAVLDRRLPDRRIDRVAGSSRGGEHGCLEHVTSRPGGRRRGRCHPKPVLGQSAGLVGADDRRLPGGLDRRHPAHDRAARGHVPGSEREGDRDRCRQSFGNRCNRHGDADEKGFFGRRALGPEDAAQEHGDDASNGCHRARERAKA